MFPFHIFLDHLFSIDLSTCPRSFGEYGQSTLIAMHLALFLHIFWTISLQWSIPNFLKFPWEPAEPSLDQRAIRVLFGTRESHIPLFFVLHGAVHMGLDRARCPSSLRARSVISAGLTLASHQDFWRRETSLDVFFFHFLFGSFLFWIKTERQCELHFHPWSSF